MCNCRFCCKDENFAYFVVNDNGKDSRMLIRSGGGMPLIILSEPLFKIDGILWQFIHLNFALNVVENWRYYSGT